MKIKVFKTIEEADMFAADLMAEVIKNKPNAVLGLATGSSPEGMYAELVRRHQAGDLDFSGLTTVNLDEYIGLGEEHKESYRYFMNHHLFNHVNIDPAKTHVPNGQATDLKAECKAYDELWRQLGGTDIQVLGIGPNGHIGFNEPALRLRGNTHVTQLTDNTIEANSRFFDSIDDVPTKAITMGMDHIMKAKKLIILAFGEVKRRVISEFANDEITSDIPVTLCKLHPDATLIVDEVAGADLI